MNTKNKKLIVFDLDGTLAPSKSHIDKEMRDLLIKLLNKYYVSVISGGDKSQFDKQFISNLSEADFSKLILCPTCGTKMYVYKDSQWVEKYSEDFTQEEKDKIIDALEKTMKEVDFNIDKVYGKQIDDRGTQITYSANGQDTPLEVKQNWDPNFTKRKKMQDILYKYIPEFTVRSGGTNSIDITKKGIDKAYGIRKLQEELNVKLDEILFIGDALMEGGNDFPVKEMGVESLQTSGPEESKKLIADLL